MPIAFRLVDGAAFAAEASVILEEAWKPPALRYTPEYLRWQMNFPAAAGLPAVAAFDGNEPVGFAAATSRHMRQGAAEFAALIVSFVGVRPHWQGQGIAAGLYATLLEAIAKNGAPAVTFAAAGSGGERAVLRAYPQAGFRIDSLGTYSNYGFVGKPNGLQDPWRSYSSDDASVLQAFEAQLASNDKVLWSMPGRVHIEHYFADPRPRKLVVVENLLTGERGAGLVVQSEFRTGQGLTTITTLDSVWVPSGADGGVRALLQAAAETWYRSGSMLLTCPNLGVIEDSALTAIRARKTGGRYSAYFCTTVQRPWPAPQLTNLEIV